jgi:hypothetical protein
MFGQTLTILAIFILIHNVYFEQPKVVFVWVAMSTGK